MLNDRSAVFGHVCMLMWAYALCSCWYDLALRSYFPWSLGASSGSREWGRHAPVLAMPTVIPTHRRLPCNNHGPLTSVMLLPTSCRDIINKNNEERCVKSGFQMCQQKSSTTKLQVELHSPLCSLKERTERIPCIRVFEWLNEIKTFTMASVISRYCCPVK